MVSSVVGRENMDLAGDVDGMMVGDVGNGGDHLNKQAVRAGRCHRVRWVAWGVCLWRTWVRVRYCWDSVVGKIWDCWDPRIWDYGTPQNVSRVVNW